MYSHDRRRVDRLDIPDQYVLDLGLWLDRTPDPLLAVRELGPPDIRSAPGTPCLGLGNLSPYGLSLHVAADSSLFLPPGRGIYLRLALRAPWDIASGRLGLFLFAWTVWNEPIPSGRAVGLRFAAHAVTEPRAKMFRLVEIQEAGLGDLARWLGELARTRHAYGLIPRPRRDMGLLLLDQSGHGPEPSRLQ